MHDSAGSKTRCRKGNSWRLPCAPQQSVSVLLRPPPSFPRARTCQSESIEHLSFIDLPVLFAGHYGYPDTVVALHNLDLIERFIREFLDKTLKQERAPLLEGSAHIPEAAVTAYGH
jgi:hypothetical protein